MAQKPLSLKQKLTINAGLGVCLLCLIVFFPEKIYSGDERPHPKGYSGLGVLYPKTLFVAIFRQKHNSEDIWMGLLFSFGYSLQKLRLFSKLTTRIYFDRAYSSPLI